MEPGNTTANRSILPDSVQQGLTMDAAVRYLTVRTTQICETARQRHNLQGLAILQSREAIVASMLMASQIKGDERLSVQLKAEQPKFSFFCDISAHGTIRAKFYPNVIPSNSSRHINGYIVTIKHNSSRELYRGVTEFNDTSIEHGLRIHLKNSSQIDCYIRIAVLLDEIGTVREAIGILLERLPESPQNPSVNSNDFHKTYDKVLSLSEEELIEAVDSNTLCDFDLFPLEKKSLTWECRCSQEKIERMLCSLGTSELRSMVEEMGGASITCDFCNTDYHCSAEKLELLIQFIEEKGN
jgi:molecular chaperone Hsp33